MLDQFTRNLNVSGSEQIKSDHKAVAIAQGAIEKDFDKQLWPIHRTFIYLPFMHAESLQLQDLCLQKITEGLISEENEAIRKLGNDMIYFGNLHKVVIEKYGRFPGRNKHLGRENTPEEEEYLQENSDGF